MGSSFLITLREGLEASLVLAILCGYLVKTNRRQLMTSVWAGAGIAAGLCLVLGIVINAAVGGLHGKVEYAVEAFIALAACCVLTWMVFWMRKHSRGLSGELRAKVDAATTGSAIAVIAFVAVLREGLETALFLISAENGSSTGAQVVIGGIVGLVISGALGYLVYLGGNKVNLRKFFLVTGVVLIFFAAGLAGKSVHEFRELFGFESGDGWLVAPMWKITSGVFASGSVYDFLKGLLGWTADPEKIRVFAYVAYLVTTLTLFVRGERSAKTVPPLSDDASSSTRVAKTPAAV